MSANLLIAAFSGFIGALIMTVFIYIFNGIGLKLDIPYLLGTRFVSPKKSGKVYITGIFLHLILGAVWGIVYIYFITAMAVRPDWPIGILFGFAHGVFIGAIIGTLSQNHPHIGEGRTIDDPGMFASQWGTAIPYLLLALHIIFGVITMLTYDFYFHSEQIPRM